MANWFTNEIYGWVSWLIIPIILEIIPAIGNFIILILKSMKKKDKDIDFLEPISLLIPVYNSAGTLENCIKSINDSNYPNELIDIILINNKTKDNSFEIYTDCQEKFPTLTMQWLNANQGKSKALNLALFNAKGKYIINIDSDGKLEKNALYNIVKKFENHKNIHCMTGCIITEPALIEETKNKKLKFLQKLEFIEYNQAFLVGRNFNSEFNNIFTLSGAFSAFRKSTILKTQLYNTNTICEDAHLTFQVKRLLNQKVALCENAIFMVDPIENPEKLYTQRQRWQIGELEVMHMFNTSKSLQYRKITHDATVRLLLTDHTFGFPRLIWYFALLALGFYKYEMSTIAIAMSFIYLLYVFVAFLNYIASIAFLKEFKEIRKYQVKKLFYLLFMPTYNTVTFITRMAGIINSINRAASWKTLNYREEAQLIKDTIKEDFSFKSKDKEKKKMGSRTIKLFVLFIFLLMNISAAIFFLNKNTENNYKNFATSQETILNSIVNTSNKDINTLTTAVKLSKTSGGQSFYLYNKTDGQFEIYNDKNNITLDTTLAENLAQRNVVIEIGQNKKVMSSMPLVINQKEYILALGTDTEYIDNNLNNSQYNMFVLIEFALLYILLVFISLSLLNVEKKHKKELAKVVNDFNEYKNKIETVTDNNGNIVSKETLENKSTNGIFAITFINKLVEKLHQNNITYQILKFKFNEQQEKFLSTFSNNSDTYIAKDNNEYYALVINNTNKFKEITEKIKENGGDTIG